VGNINAVEQLHIAHSRIAIENELAEELAILQGTCAWAGIKDLAQIFQHGRGCDYRNQVAGAQLLGIRNAEQLPAPEYAGIGGAVRQLEFRDG